MEPVPGRLALFPSFVPHATEPCGFDGERISVAFDIIPVRPARRPGGALTTPVRPEITRPGSDSEPALQRLRTAVTIVTHPKRPGRSRLRNGGRIGGRIVKHGHFLIGVAAPALLALFPGDAAAETLDPVKPAAPADTIVITGTRTPGSLADFPGSASVVTASDIQQTPAKSLDEILRAVPSLTLPAMTSTQIFPNLNTVSLRGLGAGRALALLDGIPLNDPFFGYVQWNLVPLAEVQRVEVVRGAGAALWGNYAMGGVVNIITRVPQEPQFTLDAAGGSYGTMRVNGNAAVKLSDHFMLGLDAATLRSDGYDAVSAAFHTPLTVPNRFRADNLEARLQFEIDPSLSGSVRAGYHDTAQTLHTPLNQNGQRKWDFAGNLTKRLGNSTLTATIFHLYSRLRSANTDTPTGGVAGTVEYVQNYHETPATADGGSLLWAMTDSGWLRLLSVGGDYQQLHGTDVGQIFNSAGTLIRTDHARGSQRFAGVFAQAEIAPVDALTILASARYQYFENFGGFDGAPRGAGLVPATNTSSFDPRLSVKYKIVPAIAVRGAVYRAFHAPTMNNLYRTFSNRFGIFYSNASLKPETLTGGEIGFDVNLSRLRAQVTYYDNHVSDLLTTRPLTAAERPPGFNFGTRNINSGTLHARGVEAEIDWKVTDRFSARLGYTYADSIITSSAVDPASIGLQLGGVPKQSRSLQLAYAGRGGWKVSGRTVWNDSFYSDNAHKLPIQSQFVVDIGASYPLGAHFEPYVQVQNLLGERHIADNAGTSAPQLETPRTIMAGIRSKF